MLVLFTPFHQRERGGASGEDAGEGNAQRMHEQFANRFYSSGAWKQCRREFVKARGRMCERCLAKGLIVVGTKERPLEVHHKIPLTPENIDDPAVALDWDNLELLCKDCHETERQRANGRRWLVDDEGRVIARKDRGHSPA